MALISFLLLLPTFAAAGDTICYEGVGQYFRSNVSDTIDGQLCASWSETLIPFLYKNAIERADGKLNSDYNKCRNPLGDSEYLFCFRLDALLKERLVKERCPVYKCSELKLLTSLGIDVFNLPFVDNFTDFMSGNVSNETLDFTTTESTTRTSIIPTTLAQTTTPKGIDCNSSPCKNGAKCVTMNTTRLGFICVCDEGFTGTFCQNLTEGTVRCPVITCLPYGDCVREVMDTTFYETCILTHGTCFAKRLYIDGCVKYQTGCTRDCEQGFKRMAYNEEDIAEETLFCCDHSNCIESIRTAALENNANSFSYTHKLGVFLLGILFVFATNPASYVITEF